MQMKLLCEEDAPERRNPEGGNNHRRIVCKQESLSTCGTLPVAETRGAGADPTEQSLVIVTDGKHVYFSELPDPSLKTSESL